MKRGMKRAIDMPANEDPWSAFFDSSEAMLAEYFTGGRMVMPPCWSSNSDGCSQTNRKSQAQARRMCDVD